MDNDTVSGLDDILCTYGQKNQNHPVNLIPSYSKTSFYPILPENEELYKKLLYEFSEAESYVKQAEIIDPEINGVCIPAINELRYCSYHLVKALSASHVQEQTDELSRAKRHCQRASYDALDLGVTIVHEFCRDIIKRYQQENVSISNVLGENNFNLIKDTMNKIEDLIGTNYKDKVEKYKDISDIFSEIKETKRILENYIDDLNTEANKIISNKKDIKRNRVVTCISCSAAVIIALVAVYNTNIFSSNEPITGIIPNCTTPDLKVSPPLVSLNNSEHLN